MDWLSEHLGGVFLGLAIVFGIAEMFSLDLVLLMLAMGALVGMVAALLGAPGAVAAIAETAAPAPSRAVTMPTSAPMASISRTRSRLNISAIPKTIARPRNTPARWSLSQSMAGP